MAIVVRDLGDCPYAEALAIQEEVVAAKLSDPSRDDELLLVEHPAVYTLGRGADPADLCGAPERLGVPVFRVGRGGGVTFHGPGQLVAYPILSLPPGRRDIRGYVCDLQRVLERVCVEFNVSATSAGPHPGVWVHGAKIAAIGIGVRRWVTWHGVALNVDVDASYFEAIVPCRMHGLRITTLAREIGRTPAPDVVAATFVRCFREVFDRPAVGGDGRGRGPMELAVA